jgi:hypothetical protein
MPLPTTFTHNPAPDPYISITSLGEYYEITILVKIKQALEVLSSTDVTNILRDATGKFDTAITIEAYYLLHAS